MSRKIGEVAKTVILRTEDDVLVTAKVKREKTSFLDAARRVLVAWASDETPDDPLANLSPDERKLLLAVLRFWREAPPKDQMRRGLLGIVEDWPSGEGN